MREGHDFTGHLQSSDTGFSIDRPGPAHFLTQRTVFFVSVIPIAILLIFLVPALLYPSTCNGKNAKVLSLVNCGMGAAVDIGVIREHVMGFLSMPLARGLRLWEADLFMETLGRYWSGGSQRKPYPEHRIILLAHLPWGGGRGGIPAQRIG